GDRESARFFFQSVESDPRSWNNLGVLSLMDGDVPGALSYFRKFIPQNPRLARQNMELAEQMTGDS
ncbi:tetratricopeptide repeat protein, partial [Parabacteroides chinchillae]